MEKKLIVLWIIVLVAGISFPTWAIGGGVVMMPGQVETDNGAQWEYGVGPSPQLGLTYRVNDNTSALLSIMFSRISATGKYQTPSGKEIEVTGGKLGYFHLIADGKYTFRPNKMLKPYVMGGGGLYRWGCDVEAKAEETGTKFTDQIKTGNNLGINLGTGLTIEITDNFMIATEGKYHYLFSDYCQGGVLDIVIDFKLGF